MLATVLLFEAAIRANLLICSSESRTDFAFIGTQRIPLHPGVNNFLASGCKLVYFESVKSKSSYQRSIRFDAPQADELERIAKANEVDFSQLVRWAAAALIRHVERHDGRLILPLDFSETYELIRREHPELQPRDAESAGGSRGKRATA